MALIGIAGGIGSGKSTLSAQLRLMGFSVYDTDAEARRIIDTDASVRSRLEQLFGNDIYVGGRLDRRRVASIVFSDPARLRCLNDATHPAVRADLSVWADQRRDERLCFVESAILFESGMSDMCRLTVWVTAPVDLRIRRVMARDGATRRQVGERIAAQGREEANASLADIVVSNDGSRTPAVLAGQLIGRLNDLLRG